MAVALFSTWTTYGTWLPGDVRGWYQPGVGIFPGNDTRRIESQLRMKEGAILLDIEQRATVQSTIQITCELRGWTLHAMNCRTNHVHVVLTTPGECNIDVPRKSLKAWCTRRLRQNAPDRKSWWTERGWDVWIDSEEHLRNVVRYVIEGQ